MKHHFICYFKSKKITESVLVNSLSIVFNISSCQIGELIDDGDLLIRYEIIDLDSSGKGFFRELNIYVEKSILIKSHINNNLLLVLELTNVIQEDIIINDESNDPYQYLLVNSKRQVFLVEDTGEFESVNIRGELIELSLSKSLHIFNKMNLEDSETAYHLTNPKIWLGGNGSI